MQENLYKLSVSKIASIVTGKSFEGIPEAVLEAARQRGNAIHEDIEKGIFKTQEGEWIKKQIGERPYIIEQKCSIEFDDKKITGRYDLYYPNDYILTDFKTEAIPDMHYWTIQLNLYRMLEGNKAQSLIVYHIPKTGNFAVKNIPILPKEKLDEIINSAFRGEVLPDGWWSWLEDSEAEEINLDLVVYTHDVGRLETNVDAILEAVTRKIESYTPDNYSQENIDIAKKDKAALNKSAKFLNDKRIELEKKHMEPIVKITEKIKTAKKLIEDASGKIDVIVKDVETREKDEIKKDLQDHFDSLNYSLISFDQIFIPSMLNKTAKRNDTKKAIAEKVEKVKTDLTILDRLDCPEAKAYYLRSLDLDSALREADRIKELTERLKKEKERTETVQSEKIEPIQTPEPVSTPEPIQQEVIEVPVQEAKKEEIFTRSFSVTGTKDQLNSIADFMNEKNIEWEAIK